MHRTHNLGHTNVSKFMADNPSEPVVIPVGKSVQRKYDYSFVHNRPSVSSLR